MSFVADPNRMSPSAYQKLASRTECNQTNSLTRIISPSNHNVRLIHACLGMHSDLLEFREADIASDKANVLEELGDILWYMAEAVNAMGWNFTQHIIEFHIPDEVGVQHLSPELNIQEGLGKFSYYLEKVLYYGRPVDSNELRVALAQVYFGLHMAAREYDLSVQEVAEANISKLKKRFPAKFDESANNNRDREAERQDLESHL